MRKTENSVSFNPNNFQDRDDLIKLTNLSYWQFFVRT